jgi:hypothetical protein
MGRLRLILIGAVVGLTWAASLRGFMAVLAGPDSTFTFTGTFGIIIPTGISGHTASLRRLHANGCSGTDLRTPSKRRRVAPDRNCRSDKTSRAPNAEFNCPNQ